MKEEAATARHEKMRAFLAHQTRCQQRLGFDILEHSESSQPMEGVAPQAIRRDFQTKRRQPGPPLNTQERVFGRKPGVVRPVRTQHLWDQSMGGKAYDIISHSVPDFWKPVFLDVDKRGVVKAMKHPSQSSLERGRNTQGALPPSERCTSPFLDPWF